MNKLDYEELFNTDNYREILELLHSKQCEIIDHIQKNNESEFSKKEKSDFYGEQFKSNKLKDEVWKDIKNYEGYYQISNYGNIRSLKRKWKKKTKLLKPAFENLIERIFALTIPKKWKVEGIKAPNLICKTYASSIASQLYNEYSIYPERINSSVEEGIMLYYKNNDNNNELNIEVYNDLDVAALISNNNEIIKSFDIYDSYYNKIIDIFKKN